MASAAYAVWVKRLTFVARAGLGALALSCGGSSTATVFTSRGELSEEEERAWFRDQRSARIQWDPAIRQCLETPAPTQETSDFSARVHRVLLNTPRVVEECRETTGVTDGGSLAVAMGFDAQGNANAAQILERQTHPVSAFQECVRERLCFLKSWPGTTPSAGTVRLDLKAPE